VAQFETLPRVRHPRHRTKAEILAHDPLLGRQHAGRRKLRSLQAHSQALKTWAHAHPDQGRTGNGQKKC
jgi:hypothetical protein